MSTQNKIKTVWLRNTTNGVMYEVPETEVHLYQTDKEKVVEATKDQIKAYKEGNYWKNFSAKVSQSKPSDNQNDGEGDDSLESKTKPELVAMLKELDPETELNDKNTKAELIEAIQVFQSV